MKIKKKKINLLRDEEFTGANEIKGYGRERKVLEPLIWNKTHKEFDRKGG